MKTYLAIKRLRASHVNAMTTFNVVGNPAITAHVGFAGAIAHRFNLQGSKVAILHHGQDYEGEYVYGKLSPNRLRGGPVQTGIGNEPKKMELSDQPFALSTYEVSLVFEIEGDFDDIQRLNTASNDGQLLSWLKSSARFAGGVIVNIASTSLFEDVDDALSFMPKNGHWVIDRKDLIENREETKDVLQASIEYLYPETESEVKPWMAMSQVGFVRLTPLESRGGVRQDLPHAYVEPLLGLIEYRSTRQIESLLDEPIFWSYQQPTDDSYVAQSNLF